MHKANDISFSFPIVLNFWLANPPLISQIWSLTLGEFPIIPQQSLSLCWLDDFSLSLSLLRGKWKIIAWEIEKYVGGRRVKENKRRIGVHIPIETSSFWDRWLVFFFSLKGLCELLTTIPFLLRKTTVTEEFTEGVTDGTKTTSFWCETIKTTSFN